MPATALASPKGSTILRAKLNGDGTMKYELAKREEAKLAAAQDLCRRLAAVPALQEKANAASEAIGALVDEMA